MLKSYITEGVTLDKYAVVASRTIAEGPYDLNSPKVLIRSLDLASRSMAAELHAYVWAEHLETDEREISYPLTAWDHIKRDVIPTITRILHLPVHYHKVRIKFERKAVYPKFKYYDTGERIQFVIHEAFESTGELDG